MVTGVVGIARRFPRLFIAVAAVLGLMAGPAAAATPPVLATGRTPRVLVASALVPVMTRPLWALESGPPQQTRGLCVSCP